jgi:hypothetical protein
MFSGRFKLLQGPREGGGEQCANVFSFAHASNGANPCLERQFYDEITCFFPKQSLLYGVRTDNESSFLEPPE